MEKKQRNLIITIIVIIAVFIVAAIVYPKLSKEQPQESYVPTINTNVETVEPTPKPVIEETIEADDTVKVETKNPIIEAETEPAAETSSMIPDFPLTRLDGTEGTMQGELIKGQPTVINLFASWCPPCKEEMPHFITTAKAYAGKVNFMFFDSFDGNRETEEAITDFVEKMNFPDNDKIYLDPGYISSIFSTNSIPITIFLDKAGNVDHGYQGGITEQVLNDDIEALLQ